MPVDLEKFTGGLDSFLQIFLLFLPITTEIGCK